MTLNGVVDGFSTYLSAALGVPCGAVRPTNLADLPSAALELDSLQNALTAIGARPAPSRTGALSVAVSFDLAAPELTFPDGETVNLLADDRLSLHLPYGPAVDADGQEAATLSPADLVVTLDGNPLAVVTGAPGAGQVQGTPSLGELRFGDALPAAGTLELTFFIGEWEVESARFQGNITIDVIATTSAASAVLGRQVVTGLASADPQSLPGLRAVAPRALSAAAADPSLVGAFTQQLSYYFDFEVENVNLGTGGGVIATIDVDSFVDDSNGLSEPEEFEVSA